MTDSQTTPAPADRTAAGGRVQALVMPFFRVMLTRLAGGGAWSITSNPTWDHATKAHSTILLNDANTYSERENCGVVYRMIRIRDCGMYGFGAEEIRPEWTLDPRDVVGA